MPSTLPYDEVRAALSGAPLEGPIPIARMVGKLVTVRPGERPQIVLTLSLMAAGKEVDTVTAREIELALDAMPTAAFGLASHLGAAFQTSGEDLACVQRAIRKLADLLDAALGAPVAKSTVFDATVLEATRTTGAMWGPEALLVGKKARAEELCRRVLGALRIAIETKEGVESYEASRARLVALNARTEAARARAKEIEASLRTSLGRP